MEKKVHNGTHFGARQPETTSPTINDGINYFAVHGVSIMLFSIFMWIAQLTEAAKTLAPSLHLCASKKSKHVSYHRITWMMRINSSRSTLIYTKCEVKKNTFEYFIFEMTKLLLRWCLMTAMANDQHRCVDKWAQRVCKYLNTEQNALHSNIHSPWPLMFRCRYIRCHSMFSIGAFCSFSGLFCTMVTIYSIFTMANDPTWSYLCFCFVCHFVRAHFVFKTIKTARRLFFFRRLNGHTENERTRKKN